MRVLVTVPWGERPLKTPFRYCVMSATPPDSIQETAMFPMPSERATALDHPRLQARGRGRGRGRGGGLLGLVYQIENFHRVHSVETGWLASRSAAFSVCQARVAHFTRTGNSRTPASTSSLPSATAGGASPPPATSA